MTLQTATACEREDDELSLHDYGDCRALQKHGQFITETLGAAVESMDLEDSSVLTNILIALGQIHATYQVKTHYLPVSSNPNPICIDALRKTSNRYRGTVFSARQHRPMLSALYAIARPSVTRVIHTKTVEVMIMNFYHYGSPIPLIFVG